MCKRQCGRSIHPFPITVLAITKALSYSSTVTGTFGEFSSMAEREVLCY